MVCGEGSVTAGLPRLTPAEARSRGARSLVIGVANEGGVIAESWLPSLVGALEAGLDIVSGMHVRLRVIRALAVAADRHGRRLTESRQPPATLPDRAGPKRGGK